MTGAVTSREVILRAHPGQGAEVHLHLYAKLEGGGARLLTGVVDGRAQWRELGPGEDADHRDGISLSPEWVDALRRGLARAPVDDPITDPGHTAEELAALRAELEQWRADLSAVVTVDRDRVDRLIDRIPCQP